MIPVMLDPTRSQPHEYRLPVVRELVPARLVHAEPPDRPVTAGQRRRVAQSPSLRPCRAVLH